MQAQGNEKFSISCIGACFCVCVVVVYTYVCLRLRLHLHLRLRCLCEPALSVYNELHFYQLNFIAMLNQRIFGWGVQLDTPNADSISDQNTSM